MNNFYYAPDEIAMLKAALADARRALEAAVERADVAEMNLEGCEDCSAELFALVCAVLDGKPEAQEARARLVEHVAHVNKCQRGSCDTELHGSDMRRERDAALAALRALLVRWIEETDGAGGTGNVYLDALVRDTRAALSPGGAKGER